jgi:hypothetical protein
VVPENEAPYRSEAIRRLVELGLKAKGRWTKNLSWKPFSKLAIGSGWSLLAWTAEATLQGQIAEVIELRENGRVSVRFDNGRLLMGRDPNSFERVAGLGLKAKGE